MKTIFISVFQSFVARSILGTDAFKILAEKPNIKIIIFAPDFKKEFYAEHFGQANVLVEGIDSKKLSAFSGTIINKISVSLLPTYFVKYREKIKFLDGQYLSFFANTFITYFLAPFKWARRLFRVIDRQVSDTSLFNGFFKNYNPDLFFATDIFSPSDAIFLLSAKRHGVRTIGMVRSWDCATNKNLLRILPEKIAVNNEDIKKELVKYHNVKEQNVEIVGFPQFDSYIAEKPESREEFFKKLGADSNRRLIFLAPAGSALSDIDWQYLDILDKALQNGQIPSDIRFLVSIHPQDTLDLSKFENHPNFIIKHIGASFGRNYKATEIDREATRQLINYIFHSEIVITVNTSTVLDAVIFDKPQIILGFDGYEKRPFLRSVRRYQKEDNILGFVKTGAVRIVENPEGLIYWINKYLKNPQIDSENRAKARKEILINPDGKSGQRIASFILSFVNQI